MTVTGFSSEPFSPDIPISLTDHLTHDEVAIIADHDAPQLDGRVEGGGHHPVTVLLASVEHLGIEDHLTYHLCQSLIKKIKQVTKTKAITIQHQY